jgi:serine protease
LNAPYIPNDTLENAQELPNPVTVGGYVNEPGAGPAGPSRLPGDTTDLYRVDLLAGQQIALAIGDTSFPNDLDLFLSDSGGGLVGSSEGIQDTERLLAPADGSYIIEVFAYAGASSYVLGIGQPTPGTPNPPLSVTDDFVIGEVVAAMKSAAQASDPANDTAPSSRPLPGLADRSRAVGRAMLLRMDIPPGSVYDPARNAGSPAPRLPVLLAGTDIAPGKLATVRMIKEMRWREDVKRAEPNYLLSLQLVPNDQYYPLQWHYPMINLPQAWDVTTGSSDVIVAVIDSGVLASHPDLQGRLVAGYDFIRDVASALDGDGIDDDPSDPGDRSNAGSSSFHGTHVSGTVGAATGNRNGVSGVSWDSLLMPLRVLGFQGAGTSYDIMQAMRYAAGLSNDSGTFPAQKADIINLSLGGAGFSPAMQELVDKVRAEGVIIIAAAGNDNTSAPLYPASYSGVVSVSAVSISREKAAYSNFGPNIDVAAPGGDFSTPDVNGDGYPDGVLSTLGDDSSGALEDTYRFNSGTSMASPHVAGVAALMKSLNPELTPAMFDSMLAGDRLTIDLGAPGWDPIYGYGLIDAHKAVVAAGSSPSSPLLVANPASLNFGISGTELALILENAGGGQLFVSPPTDDAAWLTVGATAVDANNNGTYTVVVNRDGLDEGTYSATITVSSTANSTEVPVIMQVRATDPGANAGVLYVLLLDQATGQTIGQDIVSPVDGVYSYSIAGVGAGDYEIIAGSDNNNDFFICDLGESCGAYLTLDQPTMIEVRSDRSLDAFQAGYITGLSASSISSTQPASPGKDPVSRRGARSNRRANGVSR